MRSTAPLCACTAVRASLSGQWATQASSSVLMVLSCHRPCAPLAARRGAISTASNSMALVSSFFAVCVSGGHELAAGPCAGNDGFHDLGGPAADLEAQPAAQALLHPPPVVAAMPMAQQALVNRVVGQLGAPPLGHAGLGGVRQALVPEPHPPHPQQVSAPVLGVVQGQRVPHA